VAAVVILCGPLSACHPRDTSRTACLAAGLRDLSGWRSVEPRLSGGFAWQGCMRALPPGHVVEVAQCPGPHPPLPPVSISAGGCDGAGRRQVLALRTLVLAPERTDEAVEMLESLAAEQPANALVSSDLAAAYQVRAQRADEPSDLLRSLAAARQAVRLSAGGPEARFNLALAEESLQLAGVAVPPGEDDLGDQRSGWAAEARARWQRLRSAAERGAVSRSPVDRQRLAEAVATSNRSAVAELVQGYPDAATRYVEEEVLPDWARSRGQPAVRLLALAGMLAGELARRTGDGYLAGVVDVIARESNLHPETARLRTLRLGHLAFGRARGAERAHRWTLAADAYRQAATRLAMAGSPLLAETELGLTMALFQRPKEVPLSRLLARLEPLAEAAGKHHDRHLLGRVLGNRALCLFYQGRALDALASYNRALEQFEGIGDAENSANVHARKAGILKVLGESELSWRQAFQALTHLPRVVELQSRHYLLGTAAASALALGHPEIALAYQNRAIFLIEKQLGVTPRQQAEKIDGLRVNLAISLRERAALVLDLGHPEPARRDLERAAGLAEVPSDAYTRHALQARVREVEGKALAASDPAAAIERFLQARRLSSRAEFNTFQAALSFELARAYRRLGFADRAEGSLKLGIRQLRQEEGTLLAGRRRGRSEELWAAYFSRFQEAYKLLIRLLVDDGRTDEAFAYAEKARAFEPLNLVLQLPFAPAAFRRLAAGGEPLRIEEVRRRLPRDTFLVEYGVLEDRLLIWVVWRGGSVLLQRPVGRAQLERWTADLLASAHRRDDPAFERALAAPFADLVAAPLARIEAASSRPGRAARAARLVFIPDGALAGLPLGALHARGSRRYLVEDHPVAFAPSATLYVFALLRDRQLAPGRPPSALLVGDPAFDTGSDLTQGLGRLPGAAGEVEAIRRDYPGAVVLTGRSATVSRFLAGAEGSAVVHFAGHAIANPRSPFRSLLLLAPGEGRSGALSAEELLSELQLERTRLFVLSACSSAGGHPIGPAGIAALVRPLIAAGVPAVLGSLWEIGEGPTEELLVEFHRHYAAGEDAASALRSAQLHLIGARGAGLRTALAWAPFQVIGHASSPFLNTDPNPRRDPP
jgi:tetratricopeptide (TPR) repeat protein